MKITKVEAIPVRQKGVPVISQGKPTGNLPGRNLLRRAGSSWA